MVSTAIYLQKACLKHKYIRTRDNSHIVERPERLRAINVGLAAAVARLEERAPTTAISPNDSNSADSLKVEEDADELTKALGQLQISTPSRDQQPAGLPVTFVHSGASVNILNNAAVKFVHGDIERDVYLENLKRWATESQEKVDKGASEIPEGYSQGDLYLSPGSLEAIQGAIGTVCEAVDAVVEGSRDPSISPVPTERPKRAFVAIRPPGHHCGEDTPSGFCFVNNVAVAAAHAHLKHSINRVVIFDIDLHHGNGTQAIAWQINEETYRKRLEVEGGAPSGQPGLQVYYSSLHDILSFPCEDGKAELVQAASVSIHGPHGQHIENVHLKPYASEADFWSSLYNGPYSRLLTKAAEFLDSTSGAADDVLVLISCGFDASEHEYPSMSRHQRKVPTSFYHAFARDAREFAERYASGRLISVLEGGYSDRALTSGAMAHLCALVDDLHGKREDSWWSVDNLTALEAATKRRRGGRPSQTTPPAPWLARTLEILASIDSSHTIPTASRAPVPPSNRMLRDRKAGSSRPSPATSPGKKAASKQSRSTRTALVSTSESDLTDVSTTSENDKDAEVAPKKLPRVILKLGPGPGMESASTS
ncbi:Arginase/deacetylase [Daedaleopsis nitida]|nr:Arginase/deacetylase [Daedaleopsis nitida]